MGRRKNWPPLKGHFINLYEGDMDILKMMHGGSTTAASHVVRDLVRKHILDVQDRAQAKGADLDIQLVGDKENAQP